MFEFICLKRHNLLHLSLLYGSLVTCTDVQLNSIVIRFQFVKLLIQNIRRCFRYTSVPGTFHSLLYFYCVWKLCTLICANKYNTNNTIYSWMRPDIQILRMRWCHCTIPYIGNALITIGCHITWYIRARTVCFANVFQSINQICICRQWS